MRAGRWWQFTFLGNNWPVVAFHSLGGQSIRQGAMGVVVEVCGHADQR
jgi:hypothetical protein